MPTLEATPSLYLTPLPPLFLTPEPFCKTYREGFYRPLLSFDPVLTQVQLLILLKTSTNTGEQMTGSMVELSEAFTVLSSHYPAPGQFCHTSLQSTNMKYFIYVGGTVLGSGIPQAAKNGSFLTGPLPLVSLALHFNSFVLVFQLPFYSWSGSHPSVFNNF